MERAVSLLHCLISHQMFFLCRGVSSFFSPVPRRQMYIFPGSSYGVGYFLFNCVCVCRTQNVLYCTAMTSREQVKCLCPSFSRFWRKVFSCSFFGSEPHTLSLVLLSLLGNVVAKRVFLGGLFSRLFAKAFLRPPFLFSLPFSKPLRYMKTDARFVWRRRPFFRLPSSQFPWKKHNSTKKPKN